MIHARLHGVLRRWLLRSPWSWKRKGSLRGARAARLVRSVVQWMYTDVAGDWIDELATHLAIPREAVCASMQPIHKDLLEAAGGARGTPIAQGVQVDADLYKARCTPKALALRPEAAHIVAQMIYAADVHAERQGAQETLDPAFLEAADALDALHVRGASQHVRMLAWERTAAFPGLGTRAAALVDRDPDLFSVLLPRLGSDCAPRCCADLDAFSAAHRDAVVAAIGANPDALVASVAAHPHPPYAPLFLEHFEAAVATSTWKELVRHGDPALVAVLALLPQNLTPTSAGVRYEQLVGHVLLADEPPWPSGSVLTSLEAFRDTIVRYLQHHWVAVRAVHGFEPLSNWCVKELSAALDVDAHALREHSKPSTPNVSARSSVFAMTSAGLGDRGTERDAPELRRGPVSLHAAVVNKQAARVAVATGHVN